MTRATGRWAPAVPETAIRRCTSPQTSGTITRSSESNRARRSFMAITQEVPQPATAATEIGAHGEAVGPDPHGDLADGEVAVVEEDHRCALRIGQLSKCRQQIRIRVAVDVLASDGS